MNYAERVAKQVVETLIHGGKMTFCDTQRVNHHDFDLHYPNGIIVPVEVTMSANQAHVETVIAIQHGGSLVPRKLCAHDWQVHPHIGANIGRVRRFIDEYLADVEAAGFETFFTYFHAWSHTSIDRMKSIGVEGGSITKLKVAGIQITYPSDGGTIGPPCLVEAVNGEAAKSDNRSKLGRSTAPERHLFVYVDGLNFRPWASLLEFDLTAEPPTLPDEITDVWAVASGFPKRYEVWRGNRSGWRSFGAVTVEYE